MANKRNKLPKAFVLALHLRSDFCCCYCGRNLRNAPPKVLSVEHITPYSHGGLDTADNLVTACMPCNRGRGTKPLAAYATPGARRTIRNVRRRKLNMALAIALLRGRTPIDAID